MSSAGGYPRLCSSDYKVGRELKSSSRGTAVSTACAGLSSATDATSTLACASVWQSLVCSWDYFCYFFDLKITRGWESTWVEGAREGQVEVEGKAQHP